MFVYSDISNLYIYVECIGSFGFECSKSCPEGYYGKQCSEKCQCKLCNSYSGECVNVTTEALNSMCQCCLR